MELTAHQKHALYQLVKGLRDEKKAQITLGGYAGTGKTTLIKYLIKFFPTYAVAAYTGKAANVLRKKGIPASTIHSRIYKPFFDNGVVYFDLTPDPGCDGFIIDEASMVSKEIFEDLKAFGLPIVFVGDHGQLEPVDRTST
jgi:exodeoxyribonuclease-5